MIRPGIAAVKLTLLALLLGAPAAAQVSVDSADPAIDVASLQIMVNREYARVAEYLGQARPRRVAIRIADSHRGLQVGVATAFVESGVVVIPTGIFRRNLMPSAHEIAHVLAGRAANVMLAEGLAVHLHDRFGEQPAFPTFRASLDEALRTELARNAIAAPRMTDVEDWIGEMGQPRRRAAYLIAGSFNRFLIERVLEGDVRRYLRLYADGEYERATGKPLAVLEEWWWRGAAR